jgi:ABC-2 type transport system permease protein
VAGFVCAWTLLLGPQIVRQDLRHDLQNADLLKMYPMPGWQVVLGQLMAPAVILTAIHWGLLFLGGMVLSADIVARGLKLSIVFSAALLFPLLNVLLLVIPNGAVLLFPAWFQGGREGPQGIEATGQRIVFALGQMLALALALIPAAGVFAILFFPINAVAGLKLALPPAAIGAAIVLAIEAGLGVMLLGRLFERFDLSREQS